MKIQTISLKEHKEILERMNQYNFQEGFMIGRNDAILEFEKLIIWDYLGSEGIPIRGTIFRDKFDKLKSKEGVK